MRDKPRQDEQTLQIVMSLLVFVGITVAGSLLLLLAHLTLGLADDIESRMFPVVATVAAGLAIAYLVRRDRHP